MNSTLKNSIKKREIKALTKAQKKREIKSLNVLKEHYAKQKFRRIKISKNTAYKKGRQFEYRVKKHFEKKGYYVKRSYASKGVEDLIAIKSITLDEHSNSEITLSEVLLIQCKNLKTQRALSKTEVDNLRKLAKQTGGTPLVAMNVYRKMVIEEVD